MELLWMVGYLILGVVTLVFVALYFYATSVMVPADQCGAAAGVYGVVPAAGGLTLNLCGDGGSEPCTFNEGSLAMAVERCETLGPQICRAFTYSEKTGEMRVVSVVRVPPPSSVTNLYRRRAGAPRRVAAVKGRK